MIADALVVIEDFIEEPEAAARSLRESPQPLLGAACYLLSALAVFLSHALSGRLYVLGPSIASLTLLALWHLGMGAAMSALAHLIAEGLGGKGRALSLFVLFGLCDLAWSVLLPLTLLGLALLPGFSWLAGVLTVLIGYWVLWLKARSISHNYGIPLAKAWTTLCLPYAAAMLGVLAVFTMAVWGLLRQALQWSS